MSGSRWRWVIGGMLFASTVINYIDRQTLSVLAPFLKTEYRWSNQDFALIVIAFRVAYALGQSVSGRWIDRLGTHRGLSLSVLWYSAASMVTALAGGLRGFAACRFLLGLGESANWPGATKAVSEWFPEKERALAVAIFDSGSSIGAAIAPALVLWLYQGFGGWRPAFVFTGCLGLVWLVAWRLLYRKPPTQPGEHAEEITGPRPRWIDLLGYRQTWGAIAGRALTDPTWFFITDWFGIYLVSKGFRIEEGLLAFWIPFVAADLGNFAGGAASSWLVARGWPVGHARKAIVIPGALGMTLLVPTIWSSNIYAVASLFGIATFCYAALSTMALTFPADLFAPSTVATVSGMGGTGAGLGTICSTYLIGYVTDRTSFEPVLIVASAIPLVAMVLVLVLVKNTGESGKGVIRVI